MNQYNTIITTYAQFILRFRWLIIIFSTAIVFFLANGLKTLKFDTDYRVFFSADNPQLLTFDNIEKTYTKNDNILFVIAPTDKKVFTEKTVQAIIELTQQSWTIPYAIRVDSISNYQHSYADEDDILIEDLIFEDQIHDPKILAQKKEIAIHEPLLLNRLISPSAHVSGVNVTLQLPGKKPHIEAPEAMQKAREFARAIEKKYPHIKIYITGMAAMNVAFPEASKKDGMTLVPLAFALILVTLTLFFKSIAATLATFLVIFFSIIAALGLASTLGITLSPPSASAPTIIMTLAVADCVHILITILIQLRHGVAKPLAITESLRINFGPVFLTSLTTAIGFASMNFSDVPPFHDLGNIAIFGVTIAFLLSVAFLPALIMVLPISVQKKTSNTNTLMNYIAELTITHSKKLLIIITLFALTMIAFIQKNELNDVFVHYFSEKITFRTDSDFAVKHLTGIYRIDYSLPSGEAHGIKNPKYLHQVEKFANWYRAQPETIHVNSITDTFKRLNKTMHNDDPAWYKIPEERNLAAQLLLLYSNSLPFGLGLNNQINVQNSATLLNVTLKTLSTKQLLALEQRAQNWMHNNTPTMQTQGSSPTMMFAYIGNRNIKSMLIGTTLALILISLTLIIALRHVKIGLLSLVPNLVPIGIAFGLWGLIVGEIGLSLSIVAAMSLGIVVDDTVHFLSKYLRAKRENNLSTDEAIRYAFSNVGMALWVTSIVLILGFLILSLSSFELNSGMGLLTAMTIFFALFIDFLFLPPLLQLIDRDKYV